MSQNNDNDGEHPPYEVGYGKPPKHTQFQRGSAGNRKGRRAGARNIRSDVESELQSYVMMTENGQKKKIRKGRAVVKKLIHDAMTGDNHARKLLFELAEKSSAAAMPERDKTEKSISIVLQEVDVPVTSSAEANENN